MQRAARVSGTILNLNGLKFCVTLQLEVTKGGRGAVRVDPTEALRDG